MVLRSIVLDPRILQPSRTVVAMCSSARMSLIVVQKMMSVMEMVDRRNAWDETQGMRSRGRERMVGKIGD